MRICDCIETLQGSGLYTGGIYAPEASSGPIITMQPAVMPEGYNPQNEPQPAMQQQPAQRVPQQAAPVKPKVLSLWPLESDVVPGFYDDERVIKPEFRYAEKQLGAMYLIGRALVAWQDVYSPTINAALVSNDPDTVKRAAAEVKSAVDGAFSHLTGAVQNLLLAANDGLTGASKAFNEIVAELRAWPANAVPAEIITEVTRYSEAWGFVTEKAAARFKTAAVTWADLSNRIFAMISVERQLDARRSGLLQQALDDANERIAQLNEKIKKLEEGGGLLEAVRGNFEALLSQGKEAVNKALNAVGASLPSLFGGFGVAAAALLAGVIGYFALKR